MQPLKRPGHAWEKSKRRHDVGQTEAGDLEVSTSDEDTDDAWQDHRQGNHDRDGRR